MSTTQTLQNIPEFLTVRELADLTGEAECTWRKRVLKRRIAVVRFGRSVRIRRDTFSAYVASNTQEAV
jgi:excisionase family DNA binding protein